MPSSVLSTPLAHPSTLLSGAENYWNAKVMKSCMKLIIGNFKLAKSISLPGTTRPLWHSMLEANLKLTTQASKLLEPTLIVHVSDSTLSQKEAINPTNNVISHSMEEGSGTPGSTETSPLLEKLFTKVEKNIHQPSGNPNKPFSKYQTLLSTSQLIGPNLNLTPKLISGLSVPPVSTQPNSLSALKSREPFGASTMKELSIWSARRPKSNQKTSLTLTFTSLTRTPAVTLVSTVILSAHQDSITSFLHSMVL